VGLDGKHTHARLAFPGENLAESRFLFGQLRNRQTLYRPDRFSAHAPSSPASRSSNLASFVRLAHGQHAIAAPSRHGRDRYRGIDASHVSACDAATSASCLKR
jgi:hypothetical protein